MALHMLKQGGGISRSLVLVSLIILVFTPLTLADLRGDFSINYVIYMTPWGSVDDYYAQYHLGLHGDSLSHVVNVSILLPQGSRLISYSGSPTINGDLLTWILELKPYADVEVYVDFKPFFTTLPIAELSYGVWLNGSKVTSNVINGSVGSVLVIQLSINNTIPYPIISTISLTRNNGVEYGYSQVPDFNQRLAGYVVDYWLMQVRDQSMLRINATIIDMGPWHSIRMNPLTITAEINLNSSMELLSNEITSLNRTLNQLASFIDELEGLSKISANQSQGFLQLINLFNQTSQVIEASAYLINSTLIIEGLLLLQLHGLKAALIAQQNALSYVSDSLGNLMATISPVIAQSNSLRDSLIQLRQLLNSSSMPPQLLGSMIDAINSAIITIGALNNAYNQLGMARSSLAVASAQLGQGVYSLDSAMGVANETIGLIRSISGNLSMLHRDLDSLIKQMLHQYFSAQSQQYNLARQLIRLRGYEEAIRANITERYIKLGILRSLAQRYASSLSIIGAPVNTTLTVRETFVINMPAIVDMHYLSLLLSSQQQQPEKTTQGGSSWFSVILVSLIASIISSAIYRFRTP